MKHILAFLITVSAISACAVNPVTGKRELTLVSEEQEINIGKENYLPTQQTQGGQYTVDPKLSIYVNQVGQRLAKVSDRPHLPYEFVVLNNGVPNAWAMPGGKIAVNRGLLLELNNEAELAAVLGHEIVHSAARHGAKSMERGMIINVGVVGLGVALGDEKNADLILGTAGLGAALISQKYGRDAELESDKYGMKYMVRAGYNPMAAVTLQETFVRLSKGRKTNWLEGLFASHPPSPERVTANRKYAKKLGTKGKLGEKEYQLRIAHLKKTQPAYDAYEKGRKALANKKTDTALQLVRQAIETEPQEGLFYILQGEAWLVKNNPEKAEASFSRSLKYSSGYFLPHLKRGLTRIELGKDAGAKKDLDASTELLPTAPAFLGLGDLSSKSGDEQKAISYYRFASSSKSNIGKQAAVKLAQLDLPKHPEKYIKVRALLSQRGTVSLKVENHAATSIKNIQLQAQLLKPSGQELDNKSLMISRNIPAGKSLTIDTGMQASPERKYSVNVQIKQAEIAK